MAAPVSFLLPAVPLCREECHCRGCSDTTLERCCPRGTAHPRAVLGAACRLGGVTVAWATPALLPPSGTARSPAAPGQQEGLAVPGDALGSSCCRGNSCGETGGGGLRVMQVARDPVAPPGPSYGSGLAPPVPSLSSSPSPDYPRSPPPAERNRWWRRDCPHTHSGGARGCMCTAHTCTYVHMLTLLPGTPSPH